MSRKRRNRNTAVAVPQEQALSTIPEADKAVAKDGYVNSLAYLGEASPLTQANDYERHSISNDFNLLTILYRENWLAARIIDTPCEDMTRAWYSISSEIEQERIDELKKLESKHNVKQEITNAIRWARLYGGAAAVMVIKGQEDMLEEPLDYDMLQPGCFRGLIVVDRVRGIFPSIELEEDMDDPEFGYPKWYQVTLDEESGEIIRIHHSRMLIFRGRQLPIDEEINSDYWGASELEHVYEELQKRNSSSANIAQLIFQANVSALKIADYGEVMGMGTQAQKEQVYRYVEEMNRLRTSFGITLMGNEDNYEQHPYSFAGVAEVYETFMMDMAGASEIPATKLFGRAPQGMNATGESDMKNYYEVISQLQERIVRPAMEKLLPVMCMSLWGEIPEDLEIVFEPLGTTTPSERAEIMGQAANPIIQAFQAGLISQRLALQELRESGKPINAWTNISDEDIEKADDEVDQGENMQDPMGMMDPGGEGGMPPEGQEMPPEAQGTPPEEQPEVDMDKVHELKERIHGLREAQETQPEVEDPAESVRKLKERVKRLRETQAGLEEDPQTDLEKVLELKERIHRIREQAGEPEPQDNTEEVSETKPEPQIERVRSLRERIKRLREGRKPDWKAEVVKKAESGDFDGARALIAKRYQKDTRRHFLRDAIAFLKGQFDGGPGSGNHNHAGRPGKKGGSAPSEGGSAPSEGGSASSEPVPSGPIDNGPQESYNVKATKGWTGLKAAVKCGGPKGARKYIRDYFQKNPEVAKEAPKYMDVRSKVDNFLKDHPDAENFNTYDAETGEKKNITSGYCVTFHQNNTETDPLGGYNDEDYANLCAIAMHELGANGVNIGYYGNPEVSFECQDEEAAKRFAVEHNQESVYNAATGRTLHNKQYNPELNPIRL